MYHRIGFKHQLWECFHHLPINKVTFRFQLQDLGFKDMGNAGRAPRIYTAQLQYVPTRKGYYMYNYMGRGRPNGMESIGNNCQDNLPKGSLSASCTAFVSFSVHGSWSGLVGGCGILKKSLEMWLPWWPRWTPYQPTLDRSHGLRIFCWNETKGTTQNTRSRPSARSFTALECFGWQQHRESFGHLEKRVAWYLMKYDEKELQTELVLNETWCLYQDHVGHVTKNSMVHNEEIA